MVWSMVLVDGASLVCRNGGVYQRGETSSGYAVALHIPVLASVRRWSFTPLETRFTVPVAGRSSRSDFSVRVHPVILAKERALDPGGAWTFHQ